MPISRNKIERQIDILEDDIVDIDPAILKLLLKDKTTGGNIMWCTKDYEEYGIDYDEHAQMSVELITGENVKIIQPRAAKSKKVQEMRSKQRAEVFTPSWICNEQNNQIDEAWFGRKNVFNTPDKAYWKTTSSVILFDDKKSWKKYIDLKRLEVTCGEAPYLVSRYDTTTGDLIPIFERIGLFDRKMRVVNENCETDEEWLKWSIRALKSIYGYEFQGDSVLIARENLLYDYMDYYFERFHKETPTEILRTVANIIAWNIWQMDGLKGVVPYSCHEEEIPVTQLSIIEEENIPKKIKCPGCVKDNIYTHNGIYCRIYDWTNLNKSIPFISLFKEED